jgi:uncharacterized protein involved in exopolysaccharide biosynthesis
MAEGFSLNDLYHSASRYWWALFACMLIGGLTGIVIAATRQPLYEASASILVTVDRGRSVVVDDFTVVQATDRVRALILSDDTLKKALDLLSESASEMEVFDSIGSFRSALRITNSPASFELLVYANEPALAAEGANAWAKASLAELDEAYLHSLRAAELQNVLYEAHCTLTLLDDGSRKQAVWDCTSGKGEIEAADLPVEILEEVKASRGILPIFSFALGEEAVVPKSPLLWGRSVFILSGLVLGMLIGFLILMLISARNRSR